MEEQSAILLECVLDLNANNVWKVDEFEIAALWDKNRQEEDFSSSEEKLLNVLRLAFDVVHYDKNDVREIARYENGEWATFTRCNAVKGNVAIRRKTINTLSDLSYENIKHITAPMLLELIDRNFGGGWDAISLALKDIIESGFDISTTQLPASRIHAAGGTLQRKVQQGYDVLEIAKGTWVEAIFAKKKEVAGKLRIEPLENDREYGSDDDDDEELDDRRDRMDDDDDDEETSDDTFYSSYSPEAEAKPEDEEGFPIEDE